MNGPIRTETVFAEIRVKLQRGVFEEDGSEYSALRFVTIASKTPNAFTPEEQDSLVSDIIESGQCDEIINALLDALAGGDIHL